MSNVIKEALDVVSRLLIANAITAPKGVGRDDIVVKLLEKEEEKRVVLEQSKRIAKRSGFKFYERDALNCETVSHIILIGYKLFYHKFNCGFCGFATCDEAQAKGARCAISVTDAGIAIGSVVKLASIFGIDNRIMLSIGQAAVEAGYFEEKVGGAYGIPLSATTKNPFFDRKK